MSEDKQKIIVMISGIVIIATLLGVVIWQLQVEKNNKIKPNTYVPDYSQEEGSDSVVSQDWEPTDFRQPVPSGVVVPEEGELVPNQLKDIVAVPHDVMPPRSSNPDAGNIRRFEIFLENNQIKPSQIIVKYNDFVDINIHAVDKEYDLVLQGYNMKGVVKQGSKGSMSFKANKEGRFKYYCETCGGINSSATGEIIVVR